MPWTEDGPAEVAKVEEKPVAPPPAKEPEKKKRASDPEFEKMIADKEIPALLELHGEMCKTALDLGTEVAPAKEFVDADTGKKVVRALHQRITKLKDAIAKKTKSEEKEVMVAKKKMNGKSKKPAKKAKAGKRRKFNDEMKVVLTALGKKNQTPFREGSMKAKLHIAVVAADGQTVKTFHGKGGKDKGLARAVRRKYATVA